MLDYMLAIMESNGLYKNTKVRYIEDDDINHFIKSFNKYITNVGINNESIIILDLVPLNDLKFRILKEQFATYFYARKMNYSYYITDPERQMVIIKRD